MAVKFLAKDNLVPWLAELAETHRTIVPKREGEAVVFRPFAKEEAPELSARPTESPKSAIFPQCDTLMSFRYTKDEEDPGKVLLDLREMKDESPAVVVGCRSCDAAGFNTFDRVYMTDKITDQNYRARRENTLFVTIICEKPATTCFCNWVGGSPTDTSGADVRMTPLEDGWVLESITEKGEPLLSSTLLKDGDDRAGDAEKIRQQAKERMPEAPDLSEAPGKVLALFENNDFWEAESAKCISCGACTYLCPTCYCFNITDESSGMEGVRLRTWDNCMSHQFTMEASGHNPRPTKAHRLKNRVGHKFSYYPNIHDGNISCVGCGRCIKSCPVSVDIRSIVLHAIAAPAETEK